MESAFTQLYKAGLVDFDFNAYLDSHVSNQKKMDYIAYLEQWEKVFGEEKILVEILDNEIGQNDVVPPIISMLGVEGVVSTYSPERHNTALGPDALHYAHLIHKENNNELLGWLLELLEEYSAHQKKDKLIFMLDVERKRLLGKYDLINRQLARKYLGREKAFSDFKGFLGPCCVMSKN